MRLDGGCIAPVRLQLFVVVCASFALLAAADSDLTSILRRNVYYNREAVPTQDKSEQRQQRQRSNNLRQFEICRLSSRFPCLLSNLDERSISVLQSFLGT